MAPPLLEVRLLEQSGFRPCGHWSVASERLTRPPGLSAEPGVYAFSIDGEVMYVGLASRSIAHRLYFYGRPGLTQRTNIRLNAIIMEAVKGGADVAIHVAHPPDMTWNGLPVSGPQGLEAGLIKSFQLPWNMTAQVRETSRPRRPVQEASSRVSPRRSLMDQVEELVAKRPGLTEAAIANALFGGTGYQQKVNPTCRRLVAIGRLERRGTGYPADPYTYFKVP